MDNHTSSPGSIEDTSSVTAGSDQSAIGCADTGVVPTGAFTEYDGACVLHLAGVTCRGSRTISRSSTRSW
jgi:hypothetical protein